MELCVWAKEGRRDGRREEGGGQCLWREHPRRPKHGAHERRETERSERENENEKREI